LLNNQVARIPGVVKAASGLENLVESSLSKIIEPGTAETLVNAGEFALGAGLIIALGHVLKKSVKKKQVKDIEGNSLEEKIKEEPKTEIKKPAEEKRGLLGKMARFAGYAARKSIVPMAATASLFASGYSIFPWVYDRACDVIRNSGEYLNMELGDAAATAAKVGLGVAGVLAFEPIYKWRIKRRHGPILKRVYVNGYNWFYERVSLRNLARKRWMKIPFIGKLAGKILGKSIGSSIDDCLTYLPRWAETTRPNERFCADITLTDYATGEAEDNARVSYMVNQEPHSIDRRISPESVKLVMDYLSSYMEKHKQNLEEGYFVDGKPLLNKENLEYISDESQLKETISGDKKSKLKARDISRILKAMYISSLRPDSGNFLDIDSHECSEYLNEIGNTDGGLFVRTLEILEGDSKTVVPRAYLMEDEKKTRINSMQALGTAYARKKKCLFSMRFSIKRGDSASEHIDDVMMDEEDLEDLEEAADEEMQEEQEEERSLDLGMASNSFERWKKQGFRKILDWGDGYKLIYKSHAFDVDMDFFGSVILWPGYAARRKYYVRDADGTVIAKMKEVNIVKKVWPIKDNDWQIDVYDPNLAQDKSFCHILALATQYFRKNRLYDRNACEKVIKLQRAREPREEAI
ncbi:hypothetical protein KY317_03165, partial [Candidatus Woesearchaeota archaeon]|nr:hypothetical protein [Candidatus Woesearchaeota archaeon]